MSDITEHFMGDFRQHVPVNDRLPTFLRRRAPRAIDLAKAIDVDPRTARNILDGHWPSREAWRGLVRAFGYDVLEVVFSTEIDHATARQTAELKRQEALLANRRARLSAVAGATHDLAQDSEQRLARASGRGER